MIIIFANEILLIFVKFFIINTKIIYNKDHIVSIDKIFWKSTIVRHILHDVLGVGGKG